MKTIRRKRVQRAFTLLEVLMVVIIIGVLAAFIVPNFIGVGEDAKVKLTRAAIDSGLNGVLDTFRTQMGRYPANLTELYERPDDENAQKNWVQLIKDPTKLRDAWQHEFIYESPGQYNKDYDLSSAGPDGQPGTEDDIRNWSST